METRTASELAFYTFLPELVLCAVIWVGACVYCTGVICRFLFDETDMPEPVAFALCLLTLPISPLVLGVCAVFNAGWNLRKE